MILPQTVVIGQTSSAPTSVTKDSGTVTLANGVGTYTFVGNYSAPPTCIVSDTSAQSTAKVSATTTTLTITGTGSDVIAFVCVGQ